IGLGIIAPVQAIMLVVGFMIFADTITGIWAAHRRGEVISSSGFRRVIVKMAMYQLAVLSAFFIEKYIGVSIPILKGVAGAIALSELSSVLENIQVITGIKIAHLPSITSFKKILSQINDKT